MKFHVLQYFLAVAEMLLRRRAQEIVGLAEKSVWKQGGWIWSAPSVLKSMDSVEMVARKLMVRKR